MNSYFRYVIDYVRVEILDMTECSLTHSVMTELPRLCNLLL